MKRKHQMIISINVERDYTIPRSSCFATISVMRNIKDPYKFYRDTFIQSFFYFLLLLMKIDFFFSYNTIQPQFPLSSLLPGTPFFPLLQIHSPPSHFRKEQASKRQNQTQWNRSKALTSKLNKVMLAWSFTWSFKADKWVHVLRHECHVRNINGDLGITNPSDTVLKKQGQFSWGQG